MEELFGWELLVTLLGLYLLAIFVLVIIPACFGTSIGVRYLYIRILHKVFDFGRRKIESRQQSGNAIPVNGFIEKSDEPWSPPRSPGLPKNRSFGTFHKEFHMEDLLEFLKCGSEAIIDDEVTKRFGTEELASWNLLTRTNQGYAYISFRLTVVWVLGFFFRYFILLPVRLSLAVIGISFLFFATFILARFPETPTRKWLDNKCMLVAFRIMARALSVIVTYHNREYKGKGGGICVANHTSPIDAVILANDNCYSLVGQAQPGVMGFVQKALARTQDHIWFERTEMKDRQTVTKRLREHVEDPSKNPILIFPEGTCINNTSVMMFKKGSFEIGGKIYPAAIKYDPTFGNAFWNSSQETMGQYLIALMTSWATVCDVWYMPAQEKLEDETAIEFANRVKREIARQGGLVDLIWDGQLKRFKVKPEFKQRNQEDYALRFKID